jgi:L-amino acid N-acyltransferase YncA
VARHLARQARYAVLNESHVWLELPLDGRPITRPVPDGIRLVRATESEASIAQETGKDPEQVRAWLADGHDLWVMLDGRRDAFSCWIFHHRVPLTAAAGGWLPLPDGVVCLEDSEANPDYRGRGIAPAAWENIAAALHKEGHQTMITKVGVDNAPSLKACAKAGFEKVGLMRLRRVGPYRRVRFEGASGASGPALARSVER